MDYNKIILIAVFFIAAFAAFFMGVGLAYCHDADMADYFSVEGFTNIRLELHEDGEINLDGEMVGWHTHQWCYDYMSDRGIVQGAAQHSWYQDELPKVEPPPPPPPPPKKPDPPVDPPMPSALEKHLADTPDYHYHSEHVDAGEHTHRGHAHGIHAWHEHNALVHSHPPKTVEPPTPTPPPVVNPPVDPPVDPPVEPPVNPPKEEVKPTKPMREQVPPHTHNFLPPHEEHEANGPHAHYYGHHSHDGYRGHGHSYGLFHTHTEPETPSPPKVSVADMPKIAAVVPVEAGMPIPVATSQATQATVDNPNNFIIPATVTPTPVDVAEVVEVVSPTAPQPRVDIVSVEFRENPDRLIVEIKNNMDTPFVFFDGFGKWELYRSNGRLFCSLMFRHVNLTFKDKTKPILMPGETTRLYLASIADYNALLPLYAEENVTHYMDFPLKGYKTRQSLMLQYRVNGALESMDTYPEPVASAPMLYPKPITMWGELKR